ALRYTLRCSAAALRSLRQDGGQVRGTSSLVKSPPEGPPGSERDLGRPASPLGRSPTPKGLSAGPRRPNARELRCQARNPRQAAAEPVAGADKPRHPVQEGAPARRARLAAQLPGGRPKKRGRELCAPPGGLPHPKGPR